MSNKVKIVFILGETKLLGFQCLITQYNTEIVTSFCSLRRLVYDYIMCPRSNMKPCTAVVGYSVLKFLFLQKFLWEMKRAKAISASA